MHYDVDDNFIVQIYGKKTLLLFPPEACSQVYLFPRTHPHHRRSQVNLDDVDIAVAADDDTLLAVDEAIEKLARQDPDSSRREKAGAGGQRRCAGPLGRARQQHRLRNGQQGRLARSARSEEFLVILKRGHKAGGGWLHWLVRYWHGSAAKGLQELKPTLIMGDPRGQKHNPLRNGRQNVRILH